MTQYFLAIDIGASSGRHILAHLEQGKMILEEIHRFPNGMIEQNGELIWDIDKLFEEIKTGMKKCKELDKIPVSVGIDTWAVDFVLLDEKDERIGNAVAYRDGRTVGADAKVYKIISETELYQETGIQKQIFNTIYQLMALKIKKPEELKKANKLLMIPDYFHYLLTGQAATEYTNATTTQLICPKTKSWNGELVRKLGFPEKIFQQIVVPGSELGNLTPKIQQELGYDCKVILPATHDTGSAVMAVPNTAADMLYISSGTWSLMGTELQEANCSRESEECNLTNEGGYEYRFRYLKNIMGLWMIQSIKSEIASDLEYGTLCSMASKEQIKSIVNCNDDRFLAPESMTLEVQKACKESQQQIPYSVGEVGAVIYNSLAKCYADTLKEIETVTGKKYNRIHIIGGGANADYLNELTAKDTRRTVYAGPIEATAIGNVAAQMIAEKVMVDLCSARECILRSFPISIWEP